MVRDAKGVWLDSGVFCVDARNYLRDSFYFSGLEGSDEWVSYWESRLDRCRNGYEVDGVKITGNHYFYLNFCRINALSGREKRVRFPDFWDGDYNYFWCLEIARNGLFGGQCPSTDIERAEFKFLSDRINDNPDDESLLGRRKELCDIVFDRLKLVVKIPYEHCGGGYHFIAAKSRRKGYSYKNASICVNMYNSERDRQIIVGAGESRYLYPSGTMAMVHSYMEFLNTDTGWVKSRDVIDRIDHRRASYKVKEKGGRFVEKGYKSEVFGINFNSNPDAIRGKDPRLVLLEEAGDFPNLGESYGAIYPSLTAGKYITGQMIVYGTGGSIGNEDFINMFYNPLSYGIMPFYNIWDQNCEQELCGFFHPVTWNMEGFYDEQGNSDIEGATQHELRTREKLLASSSNRSVLNSRVNEFPLTPGEAFTLKGNSTFPIDELQAQLRRVTAEDLQKKMGVCVEMYYHKNKLECRPDLTGSKEAVINYSPKIDDLTGCPIVYEFPSDNPPAGLYKIGYDPYRQDQGKSMAAVYVYKGVKKGDYVRNTIVAEYVGRPREADMVNRVVEMFCKLYNAQCLYENEVTHVKNYFRRTKNLHLLARQPDAVISANIHSSRVNRVYGIHMTAKLKDAGEKYISDWLTEVRDYDEEGRAVLNLETIYSIGLLEELIKYNRKGNFDRVMSFMMCMFAVQEEEIGKEYGEVDEQDVQIKNIYNVFRSAYER